MIYIHGGSFVGGSCESYRSFCASIAHASATKIIMPKYRLSPEHPFPAALEDIQAVLREVLPVEKNVIIAADGTGASIALACAINMRGKYRHSIQQILLFSPVLDLSSTSPILSDKKAADEIINAESLRCCADIYTYHSNLKNPLVSPMHAGAEMLQDFPPVYIQAGGREILADDIRRFEQKLKDNSVPHVIDIEPDMMFMFQMADEYMPQAHKAVERVCRHIKQSGAQDEE
jgi:acetyl esterase/lipase